MGIESMQKENQINKITSIWLIGSVISLAIIYAVYALSSDYSMFSNGTISTFSNNLVSPWMIFLISLISCSVVFLGAWRYNGNIERIKELVTIYGLLGTWLLAFIFFKNIDEIGAVFAFVFTQYAIAWTVTKTIFD